LATKEDLLFFLDVDDRAVSAGRLSRLHVAAELAALLQTYLPAGAGDASAGDRRGLNNAGVVQSALKQLRREESGDGEEWSFELDIGVGKLREHLSK